MTLVEFLEARISEVETAARACAEVLPAPWTVEDRGHRAKVTSDAPNFLPVAELDQRYESPGRWPGEHLEHIARHDPARVLAECASKRAILALHVDNQSRAVAYRSPRWADAMNDQDRVEWRKAEARLGTTDAVLRALALPDADHPDYDEAWRP